MTSPVSRSHTLSVFPPAHAAIEYQAILLNGDVGGFGAKFFAQGAGELFVFARV